MLRVVHPAASFVVCLADGEVDGWLRSYDAGELDAAFDRFVARPPRRVLGRVPRSVRRTIEARRSSIGIEHEFEVWRGDRCVPFGSMINQLALAGVRADPADPNAHRSRLGVVTVDGIEAEVATPPIPIQPDCPLDALEAANRITTYLEDCLPDGHQLVGVSTHVSVSWTQRRDVARSRSWAAVFAPVVMLLMDRPSSPGLLVRPRPGRLELCGEHVVGDRLRATVAVAVASVELLASDPLACQRLAIQHRIEPAIARFGWYVDRAAVGNDLYQLGRGCPMVRLDGTVITAGQQLLDVTRLLTPIISRTCGVEHADLVREFAEATSPLGCELLEPKVTTGAIR